MGESTKKSPDRTEYFNAVKVSINDGSSREMTVWRAFYPDFRMVGTRAAIWSTPIEDFYIVSTETLNDGRVVFRFLINPFVWWMWLAGPIAILGTVVALWPKYSRSPIPSKGRTVATEAGT